MKRLFAYTACCLFSLMTGAATAAEPAQCQTTRIGIVGWTDVVATTGLAEVVLEALGYKTSDTTASQQIVFAGIEKGQLDFYLGYWKPAMDDNIKPFLDKGSVKVLGHPGLPDAIATLAVPTYAAKDGLKTFADIARFKDQLDGKIYGIEPGTGANTTIQKMIDDDRFGLGDFKLIESSEAAMLAAVTRAVRQNKPVVFVGWKPHPMNIQMDLTYLTGSEDLFGANEGAATVSTVTAPDYAQRCPNVNRLLDNLVFNSAQVSELMAPIMDRKDPQAVARDWLREHPQAIDQWLAGVTTVDGQDGAAAVKQAIAQ